MFLLERLFAVLCYSVVLMVVYYCISNRVLSLKLALNIYLVILSLFAFLYIPYETADLYRIQAMIEVWANVDFDVYNQQVLNGNTVPVAYLLYWIIGKIGNPHLLPMIAVIITYSSIFYIIKKSAVIFKNKMPDVALVVLFIMSTGSYMMTISNIRTMIAISLICFCFFRESIMRTFKIWHILLYIIAALTHNLAIILIIFRCLAFFSSSQLSKNLKALICIAVGIIGIVIVVKYKWIFDSVFETAVSYIRGDSYSYIWEYIIGVLVLMIEIYALSKRRQIKEFKLKETKSFLLVCILFACALITQFSIFHRLTTYIAPILTGQILLYEMSNKVISGKQKTSIFLLCLGILFIVCARGSLSSLKFFIL